MIRKFTLPAAMLLCAGGSALHAQEKVIGPVKVKIQEEKAEFFAPALPVDPARRAEFQTQAGMKLRVTCETKQLHQRFIDTTLKIDDQVLFPGTGAPWRLEIQNVPLPKTASGKVRDGFCSVYTVAKIRITQSAEIVSGWKPGQKQRLRDTVLVRYVIENKDSVPHKVGMFKFLDVDVLGNDGALFAAPNQPGKILDGVELKGKTMPAYLQFLQNANLENPGFVGHMTFDLGNSVDKPDRVILTSMSAASPNNWDTQVMRADGDSAMSVYWDPKQIKPGGKRELAFAFGGGIAASLENEGKLKIDLAGSFEPGKLFTINAHIIDPAQGQNLTLTLPAGMELMHGKDTQPVPQCDDDGNCLVQWQARVIRTGKFTMRVESSTGAALTSTITITPVEAK